MSKFTGPLTITEISADDELWRFEEELVYYRKYEDTYAGIAKSGEIIVPKGFISDGASVPSFLERWWPRWGKWRRPAAMHDYLCSLIDIGFAHQECPDRKTADAIFWESMGAVGVKLFDKVCLFIGAKLATWFPALGKGVVRNDEVAFENVGKPSKTPAVITNKGELTADVLLEGPNITMTIETNKGSVAIPPEMDAE